MKKCLIIFIVTSIASTQLFAQTNTYPADGNVGIGTTAPISKLDIVTGIGDGSVNEANCLRLRHSSTIGNSQLLQLGVSNQAAGGNNNGYGYISSVYWGASENNPLVLNPKGGSVGFGLTTGVLWNVTAKGVVAIRAESTTANNTLMGKLVFAHWGPYSGKSSFIAGVYDKTLFSQGAGLVFHTISGSDISGVDGVERMRISSDGNVGIGTSNPTQKLSIQAATGNAVDMALRNTDGTSLLSLATDGGAMPTITSYYGLTFNSLNSPYYSFKLAGNDVFSIRDGKVGIGNSTPQAPLHIVGGIDPLQGASVIFDKGAMAKQFYLSFYGDNLSQAFIGQPGNVSNRLDLGTGAATIAMTLLNNRVGIGTTSPQASLHVAGGLEYGTGYSVIYDKGTASKQFYLGFYADNAPQAFIGQPSNAPNRLDLGTGGSTKTMTLLEDKVGIGSTTPAEKLDVNGNVKATGFILPTGAAAGKVLTSDASGNASWQTGGASSAGWGYNGSTVSGLKSFGTVDNYDLPVITNNTERMRVLATGGVIIGGAVLPATDALLAVNGTAYARKIQVTLSGWADYVFHANYRLRPLSEVEQYINQYHHLPEVPTTEEVEKKGLDLGDNQATLLKKIEELTLYVIEQQKEITALKKEVEQVKSAVK